MAVYLKCSTAVRCLIHAQAQQGCRPSARAVVIERLTTVPVQDGSTPHGPAPVLAPGAHGQHLVTGPCSRLRSRLLLS
jgi:hypothetical protein